MAHLVLFTLVLLQCYVHQTAGEIHCITVADSTKLGSTQCVTLSQFATNIIHYVHPNSTLVLHPGRHYLTLNVTLSNVDNFSMISESSTAQIVCKDYSHIFFNNSQHIHITNLEFIRCGGNLAENVQEFVVRDTTFKGEENSGTVLELVETTAEIINSTFVSNKGKVIITWTSYGYRLELNLGGAIIANKSNLNINQCIFMNNTATNGGGVLYSDSSNITIQASEFDNNIATNDGGVLYSRSSTITIQASEFDNNIANDDGGVLYSSSSDITIEASEFENNTANDDGGVLYSKSSTITIEASEFENNTANDNGGVLYSSSSDITIEASEFENNTAIRGGVLYSRHSNNITIETSEFENNTVGGVLYSMNSNITIEASEFKNNTANTVGGVLYSWRNNITIEASEFKNNTANDDGGVLCSWRQSNITIEASEFENNTATRGGVLYSLNSNITIEGSEFENNTANNVGGVLYSESSTITIEASEFENNTANDNGGVLCSWSSTITIEGHEFDNNTATRGGVLYSDSSTITIEASEFEHNTANDDGGVLYSRSSNITIEGSDFDNNIANDGGGVLMTQLQSNVFFDGTCSLKHNKADFGGAIFSNESKLHVTGNVIIAHNTATLNGGGVYLLSSNLSCQQLSQSVLLNNVATLNGGGLHAISSFIKVFSRFKFTTNLILEKNTAERGGALSLGSNAKLYILKYDPEANTAAVFTANTADYGGAVYVDDDTISGTCASDPKAESTECFFQVLAMHTIVSKSLRTQTIHFSNNKAYKSGSTLYGGLLDRCAVSQFAEVHSKHLQWEHYEYAGNGVDYFYDVSAIADNSDFSISSRAVQVCLCFDNEHNCTYQHHIEIKKGETFTVSLAAVDQIGHALNSTIKASLNSTESNLLDEGQMTRRIPGEQCTNLTFKVLSVHNTVTEALTLYPSDGRCKDAGINVTIRFLPCSCPVGLQVSSNGRISCTCDCHTIISQYVEDCNIYTGSFVKKPEARAWISYINHTNIIAGYLIYPNCPYDYCNSSSSRVNLNQPDGADAQCAFNRSSLLCGSCRPDQSLSLGSSRCISCPSYWPALFLTITIAAALAGIALVALLLVLNMSVAVGTLNGLIFYANVVYVNKSILLPFQESNFLLVFMSWLNLELGIDTCYFPGMDTYVKLWLQLAFPTYLILLVVLVIIISSYSIRFSNLIGKKDPVATLATLILLSYAKVLEICFKSLSVGILEYPDGSHEKLWLPDATVKYLSGKHIPLFIVAVLILLTGLVYTALLFSWQWLLLLPRWRIFKWSRNPKLQTFIQTYHTPYASKHRYWTGLLLLARVVLYLVAALNVSNNPQISLVAINFTVICIVVLIGTLGRVYSKWSLGMLEILFHWNILLFAVFTWYTICIDKVDRSHQEAVAYTSVIITFLVLLLIILYHLYTYTSIFSKIKTTKPGRMIDRLLMESDPKPKPKYQCPPLDDDINRFNELLDMIDRPVNTEDYKVRQKAVEPTRSVVEVHKSYLAPPDPKDADSQYLTGTAQTVELRVDEGNCLEMEENIKSCVEQKVLSNESQV